MASLGIHILSLFLFGLTMVNAKTYIVAEAGADFTKIQEALNVAIAGDTILVREKTVPYFEELTFPRSGDKTSGYIVLMSYPNENPVIDGQDFPTGNDWPQGLVKIVNKSYIKVIGFELRNIQISNNNLFPAGIWVFGSLDHIEILNNKIHSIQQKANNAGAHGLAVYGTHSINPISEILIDGNEIYNCELGWSESLVLNGNVEKFIVSNNIVHDNNNIAFDFIGHEGESSNPELDQARNGLVTHNVAFNIDSRGNPAYGNDASAVGFYVDGGKDIILERNLVYNCNIGFEIASEHGGKSTSGIIIRNNFIRNNIVVGLTIGGYDQLRGSADSCFIINNTFYKNNTENFGWGAELLLQYYCNNNIFANNIFYSKSNIPLLDNSTLTGSNNNFRNNIYFSDGNALWLWSQNRYSNFDSFISNSAESESFYENPLIVAPLVNNPSLEENSPAINNGIVIDSSIHGTHDFLDSDRILFGNIDVGAVESDYVNGIESFDKNIDGKIYLNSIYPNPFNSSVTFEFKTDLKLNESLDLAVYNSLGQSVFNRQISMKNEGKIIWNASNYSSGIYFVKLYTLENSLTKKIALIK